ncbi:MAG: mRNA surveillance protein pelota, partial [Candidatus Njordarchaeales archaeon]
MLIEEFDPKHNKITVRVHSVDDLYVLYSFIKPGDMVTAKTSRKVKFTEKESARVPMILTIEVQNVSFQEFAER